MNKRNAWFVGAAAALAGSDPQVWAGTAQPWLEALPQEFQASVLWYADHEEGILIDWDFGDFKAGGGGVITAGGN